MIFIKIKIKITKLLNTSLLKKIEEFPEFVPQVISPRLYN